MHQNARAGRLVTACKRLGRAAAASKKTTVGRHLRVCVPREADKARSDLTAEPRLVDAVDEVLTVEAGACGGARQHVQSCRFIQCS